MRIRPPARIAAFACLGIALGMAALALRDTPPGTSVRSPQARSETEAQADPLQARLLACRQEGAAAASDPKCLRAWEENRRHFLLQREPEPPEPEPGDQPGKSTEPVPIAPEDSGATSQEQ